MSVRIMAEVFAANMPELKTDDGKTVPDSTAKFVLLALADHASDDGENAYIGVRRLCQKTNFSTATVCNALNALRENGFITLVGKSKKDTNNYTINAEALQRIKFQPLESADSSHWNPTVLAAKTNPSLNHPLNHDIDTATFAEIVNALGVPNPRTADTIKEWLKHHESRWILKAIADAKTRGVHGAGLAGYVDAMLISWQANGYPKSREEKVQAARAACGVRSENSSGNKSIDAINNWLKSSGE